MLQAQHPYYWPIEPTINLVNMELEASFEMATFSLAALETLNYPTRSVIDNQSDAQAHVFGHWKNFKTHFLYFQDLDSTPYKRTLSLLVRLHALLGPDVALHIKDDVKTILSSKSRRPPAKSQPAYFANFYLGMLHRDIKAGKC